jgi:hypothetical protein
MFGGRLGKIGHCLYVSPRRVSIALNCNEHFVIKTSLRISSTSTVTVKNQLPYNSTIYLSMEVFSHGRSMRIYNRTDICVYPNLGIISKDGFYFEATESSILCPLRADVHYLLLTYFTVPELYRRDSYVEFIPDLMLFFHATADSSSPMIGCIETGNLAKLSLDQQRANRGALAFFVSIFCFVATSSLCLYGYSRRRQAVDLLESNRIPSIIRRQLHRKSFPMHPNGSVSLVPSLTEGQPISSSSGFGCSVSSSYDPPRSRSERTISTTTSGKKSFSGRSDHSITFLPTHGDATSP